MTDERRDNAKEMSGTKTPTRNWAAIDCYISGQDYEIEILQLETLCTQALNNLKDTQEAKKKGFLYSLFSPNVTQATNEVHIKYTRMDLLYHVMKAYTNDEIQSPIDLQKTIADFIKIQNTKTEGYGLRLNGRDDQNVVFTERNYGILQILTALNKSVGGTNDIEFLPSPLKEERTEERQTPVSYGITITSTVDG